MAHCLVLSARAALAGHVIDGLEAAGHSYGLLLTPEAAAQLGPRKAREAEATPLMRSEPFAPEFLSDLVSWCAEAPFDVVIGADLLGTRLAAQLATREDGPVVFPTASPTCLEKVNDKWSFYQTLVAAGVPTPKTWLLARAEDIHHAPWDYPVIAKPCALGGGLLVTKAEDAAALYDLASRWPAAQFPILVQEFVPGEDVDISVLAKDGEILAATVQRWITDTELEMLSSFPAVEDTAARTVAATSYTGVAHFDLRLSEADGRPMMIECNPRFWATLDASLKTGVNFADLGVRTALGLSFGDRSQGRAGRVHYPGPPGHTTVVI